MLLDRFCWRIRETVAITAGVLFLSTATVANAQSSWFGGEVGTPQGGGSDLGNCWPGPSDCEQLSTVEKVLDVAIPMTIMAGLLITAIVIWSTPLMLTALAIGFFSVILSMGYPNLWVGSIEGVGHALKYAWNYWFGKGGSNVSRGSPSRGPASSPGPAPAGVGVTR